MISSVEIGVKQPFIWQVMSEKEREKTEFVFPKQFEMFKFLLYALEKSEFCVTRLHQVDEHEYKVALYHPEKKETVEVRLLLIGDSDINFYGIFAKLANTSSYKLLLGSCGSSQRGDIGKCFVIEEAVKGDRGVLNSKSEFTWESKKYVAKKHGVWPSEISALRERAIFGKKICSTNFLNENVIHESFAEDFLFDMETYDFYDVCTTKNLGRYVCVRFVTDYVCPLKLSADDDKAHHAKSEGLILEKYPELNELALPLAKLKKYYRLRIDIDFGFIFGLDLPLHAEPLNIDTGSVQKIFNYFLFEFNQKLKEVHESLTFQTNALEKNHAKLRTLK